MANSATCPTITAITQSLKRQTLVTPTGASSPACVDLGLEEGDGLAQPVPLPRRSLTAGDVPPRSKPRTKFSKATKVSAVLLFGGPRHAVIRADPAESQILPRPAHHPFEQKRERCAHFYPNLGLRSANPFKMRSWVANLTTGRSPNYRKSLRLRERERGRSFALFESPGLLWLC